MSFQKDTFQSDAFEEGGEEKPSIAAFESVAFQQDAFQTTEELGETRPVISAFQTSGFQLDAFQTNQGVDATVPPVVPPVVVETPSGVRGSRRQRIAVVEYDGRDYRVPLESLDSFLDLVKKKAETPAPVKVVSKKKKKTLQVTNEQPPKLVIKSAPAEVMFEFEQFVDRSNEILEKIWQGLVARTLAETLAELDDEEAMLLLM